MTAFDHRIDALPYQAAILNSGGVIIAVNQPWRQFAHSNGGNRATELGEGMNYLDICRNARGRDADEAPLAASAIREVLDGNSDSLQFEYPCHSPSISRWYRCTAVALHGRLDTVMVSHVNFTWSWSAAVCEDRRAKYAQLQGLPRQPTDLIRGTWDLDLSLDKLRWSEETYRLHGLTRGEFSPTFESALAFYARHDRDRIETAIYKAMHFGISFYLGAMLQTAAGRQVFVHIGGRVQLQGIRPHRLLGVIEAGDLFPRR